MALMYVLSQKGKNLLVHNNFIHRKEKETNEKIIWKCNDYKKLNCRGRVHTIGESVVKYIDHTHVPDITKIKCKEFVNEVKEIAITSQLTTHAVLGVVTAKTDVNIASQLPPINQLKRMVQRTRKQISSAPPNPATLSDLSIPDEYKKSVSGEPFLLYDSFLENVDNKRILLFSTLKNLELLQNSYYWFADGTFSCTPKLFTQLYTIHSIIDKNVIPLVYVLLPDKSEDTYRRMFVALNSIKSNLNPKLFMLDFEKAAMNAVVHVYPETQVKGCFFHLGQSFWRRIQSLGLSKKYSEDPEYSLCLRKLLALAYVPENKVIDSFESLISTNFYEKNQNSLTELLDYFEDTYIGRPNRRGHRRPALFDISIWNCYELIQKDIPRTNNAIEGWHNGFNSMLNAVHPSIWTFINALKKEDNLNQFKVEQAISGYSLPKKRKYKDSALWIKNLVLQFEIKPIDDYLRGIAANFQLQI